VLSTISTVKTVKQIKKRIPKRNPPKKTPFNPNG
jgi:hypothetical protein